MTIYLASDHAGFELKNKIKAFVEQKGFQTQDCGAFSFEPTDDYPDFIKKAAELLSKNPGHRAIILGGSGQGEAMAANRFNGVRAAVYYGFNEEIIRLSREHNDANALSIGARFVKEDDALKAVELFLNTPFSNDQRHKRRIDKIDI